MPVPPLLQASPEKPLITGMKNRNSGEYIKWIWNILPNFFSAV